MDWNEKYSDRGRYIEQLEFFIKDVNFDSERNEAIVEYQNAFLAPKLTTYDAQVDYTIGITVIGLKHAQSSKISSVSGSICVNDWTSAFWCKMHGLNA